MVTERAWYWYKDKYRGQKTRNKSPEINPYTYVQLIFKKGAKTIQLRKNSFRGAWVA